MVHGVCVEAKVFVRRPRGRRYRGDYVVEKKGTAVCTSRGYKRENSQCDHFIVQELCESQGGRPGLSVLTSLLVSVDVKNY